MNFIWYNILQHALPAGTILSFTELNTLCAKISYAVNARPLGLSNVSHSSQQEDFLLKFSFKIYVYILRFRNDPLLKFYLLLEYRQSPLPCQGLLSNKKLYLQPGELFLQIVL